jgi:hypothetical protein
VTAPTRAPLLTPREAAEYLRVSLKTLRRMPVKRVVYNDRTFRYRPEDLEQFVKGHAA